MTELGLGLLALFFLLAAGFYSGCEMGLYSINRIRLRLRAEQDGSGEARLLLGLIEKQEESVLSVLLWQNVAGYLLTVATAAWLTSLGDINPNRVEFYTAAILSPLAFAFGDVVPKNWLQIEADWIMYRVSRVLWLSVMLMRWTGIVWLLEQVPRLAERIAGGGERLELRGTRGEVLALLREGAAEGALTEEQAQIVERVLSLGDVRVGSLMIPRRKVLTFPVEGTQEFFRLVVRRHPYSHLPVLSRDRRTVAGVVNVNDTLADREIGSIERHLRPPITVGARDSAAKALVQLQRADVTLAIVTDPRRGFVGIITVNDIVEEIFADLPS